MLIAEDLRERLALYCMVKKQTQEQAANKLIGEMLDRLDPETKQRMSRAKELQEMMNSL